MCLKVVLRIEGLPLQEVAGLARMTEEAGADALVAAENRFDGFLPFVLAAEHTSRIAMGPSVAIAFPRSPMITAQLAWELQRYSAGRFQLGLGTQVRGHIQRRFGLEWQRPVQRMREYVAALRAVWHSFQTGGKLDVRGDFYNLSLLPPQFSPGPIDHPSVPVLIAGVNANICRLAGEACDGLLLHPLGSPAYVRQVARPAVEEGARRSGRSLDAFEMSASGFVITGQTKEEVAERRAAARERIAFYGSTPTYQTILAVHGWEGLTSELHQMSREGKWKEMADAINDEMMDAFCLSGTYDEIGGKLRERWHGLATRVEIPVTAMVNATPEQRKRVVRDLQGV